MQPGKILTDGRVSSLCERHSELNRLDQKRRREANHEIYLARKAKDNSNLRVKKYVRDILRGVQTANERDLLQWIQS